MKIVCFHVNNFGSILKRYVYYHTEVKTRLNFNSLQCLAWSQEWTK